VQGLPKYHYSLQFAGNHICGSAVGKFNKAYIAILWGNRIIILKYISRAFNDSTILTKLLSRY